MGRSDPVPERTAAQERASEYVDEMIALQEENEEKIVPRTIRLVIDVDVNPKGRQDFTRRRTKEGSPGRRRYEAETWQEFLLREALVDWQSDDLVSDARLVLL